MVKTTLYLKESMAVSLRQLAKARGRRQSELIREALESYLEAQDGRPMPRGVGAYASGRADISERAEELLAEMEGPGN